MTAYYNDFDGGACEWLRELIKGGHIADGVVDNRSILEVEANELKEFTQCHFFAGIGGWSYALRLAGWADDRPVWTGSPPCQPFSAAGKRDGKDDERHLAPHFLELVKRGRPPMLFGEQVASADVFGKVAKPSRGKPQAPPQWAWLDDVSDRLEAACYAVGATDISSASVGAPNIRQRTFFGAYDLRLASSGVCDALGEGLEGQPRHVDDSRGRAVTVGSAAEANEFSGLADPNGRDASAEGLQRSGEQRLQSQGGGDGGCADQGAWAGFDREPTASPTNGFWRNADWLFCRDGRWRPVEASTFPLAHGVSSRMGLLRGYGNAINPQVAKEFIEAFTESMIEELG